MITCTGTQNVIICCVFSSFLRYEYFMLSGWRIKKIQKYHLLNVKVDEKILDNGEECGLKADIYFHSEKMTWQFSKTWEHQNMVNICYYFVSSQHHIPTFCWSFCVEVTLGLWFWRLAGPLALYQSAVFICKLSSWSVNRDWRLSYRRQSFRIHCFLQIEKK